MLTADDKWAIGEALALHGHLFDSGQLDRLGELFTADVHYDLKDFGWTCVGRVSPVQCGPRSASGGDRIALCWMNVRCALSGPALNRRGGCLVYDVSGSSAGEFGVDAGRSPWADGSGWRGAEATQWNATDLTATHPRRLVSRPG
ncbi:nuclear transport factor 2 family protein [Nocardia sp. NPDC052566]|uniref:nuclear transport factor 2 family protein n=1 Tax=Nocardia sp. NPDC052566 TaxID=3364330 RepID=UPI0037C75E1A